jgi:hypothetical protein
MVDTMVPLSIPSTSRLLLLLCCVVASSYTAVSAWTPTGSIVSSFGGSVLITGRPGECSPSNHHHHNMITMKKGKPNVPQQMRTQYKQQQELAAMREQMAAASKPGPDGLPIFNLFVRTKTGARMWYPCGSFKGDQRSAALAKNYANGGLLSGVSKKQIDAGIAGSLFRDQKKLAETICRSYPALRKSTADFEYGYKLACIGLSEEQSNEIKVVEPKETKGLLDNIKNVFSSD